jgi:mono/diheme cytochrome c family protein
MRTLLLIALFASAAACGKNTEPPPPSTGSPMASPESGPRGKPTAAAPGDPKAQAQKLFATLCATCHGADGTGNGPAAETLDPKPRNYTDPAWQASVTDGELKQTIVLGGQAVGKSAMMPGQPALKDQPEVLDALVEIIRGFAK